MSLAAFIIGLSLGLLARRRPYPSIAEMELENLANEFRNHLKLTNEQELAQ